MNWVKRIIDEPCLEYSFRAILHVYYTLVSASNKNDIPLEFREEFEENKSIIERQVNRIISNYLDKCSKELQELARFILMLPYNESKVILSDLKERYMKTKCSLSKNDIVELLISIYRSPKNALKSLRTDSAIVYCLIPHIIIQSFSTRNTSSVRGNILSHAIGLLLRNTLPYWWSKLAVAALLSSLGEELMNNGLYSSAVSILEKALELIPSNTCRLLCRIIEANILFRLGTAYSEQGEYEKAIKILEKSVTKFRVLSTKGFMDTKWLEIYALMNLANAFSQSHRFREALNIYREVDERLTGIDSLDKDKAFSDKATLYANIALTLIEEGRVSEALLYAKKAASLINFLEDDLDVASIYNILGMIYSRMWMIKDAMKAYHKALEILSDRDDLLALREISSIERNLAVTLYKAQLLEEALEYTKASLVILEEILRTNRYNLELLYDLIATLLNKSIIEADLGRIKDSEQTANKALEQVEFILSQSSESHIWRALDFKASILENLGLTFSRVNPSKALKMLEEATHIYRELSIFSKRYRGEQAVAHMNLAVVQSNLGLWQDAENNYKLGEQLFHEALEMGFSEYEPDYARLLLNYAALKAETGKIMDARTLLNSSLNILEKLLIGKKAPVDIVAIAETLYGPVARYTLFDTLYGFAAYEKIRSFSFRARMKSTDTSHKQSNNSRQSLDNYWRNIASLLRRKLNGKWVFYTQLYTLNPAQKKATLLGLILFPSGHTLVIREQLDSNHIKRYNQIIRAIRTLPKPNCALRTMLTRHVLPGTHGKTIASLLREGYIIYADFHPVFETVPVALLYIDDKPLWEYRGIISLVPSIYLLLNYTCKGETMKGELIVIGYADNKLKWAEKEAEIIAHLLGTKPITGLQANREILLKSSPILIFHFAGHTVINQKTPALSYLLLADGPLTAEEIYNMEIRLNGLIYLSSCESAISSRSFSLEIGLAPELFTLGAVTIIASTQKVEDDTASRFAEIFYSNLVKGTNSLEAYKRALKEVGGWHMVHIGVPFRLKTPENTSLCPKETEEKLWMIAEKLSDVLELLKTKDCIECRKQALRFTLEISDIIQNIVDKISASICPKEEIERLSEILNVSNQFRGDLTKVEKQYPSTSIYVIIIEIIEGIHREARSQNLRTTQKQ